MLRLFFRVNLGQWRAGEWADLPPQTPGLLSWRASKLVTDVDYNGQPAPDVLPTRRCCGL